MKAYVAVPASLALVLSIASCDRAAAPAADNSASSADASTAEAEAVKTAFAAFNAAIAAKDLDAIRAQYASDAVMVIPNQAPYRGIDAIMADYQAYAGDSAAKYAPGEESTHVSAGGDMAFGEVTYQSTSTNARTKAVETAERYNLTVYRKQGDGSWKVVRDVNSDVPKSDSAG